MSSRRPPSRDDEDALQWVEQMAKYLWDQDRMPMIAGRILGWLMICDPPEQTAGQISRAIGASRASLTSNLRMLGSVGFLSEHTRPGDRSVYYRAAEDAFGRMIARQVESMRRMREILQAGTDLAAGGADRGERLHEAIEAFSWLERALAKSPPRTKPRPGRGGVAP